MAFWDRFKRDRVVTEDVDVYAEPGTGRLASFLFGFFALFVTLLIVGGLFFAGRAVYRAITDDSNGSSSTQDQGQQNAGDQQVTPATPAPTGESNSNGSSSSDNSSSSGQSPSTGDTPASVPSTGDDEAVSTQALPRTGDEGL